MRLFDALKIYADKRMLVMVGLGFSSGFPLMLVSGTLSLWLGSAEVALASIGIFSLVKMPYSFKWLWSPIIDHVRLPLLGKLGRRRGWAFFCQIVLMAAIVWMALLDAKTQTFTLAMAALLVVIASASQDIVVDAYRIESFSTDEQGAAAAIFVLGYRLGILFSGALALILASVLSWREVYLIMALGAVVGMVTTLLAHEPDCDKILCINTEPARGTYVERIKRFFVNAVVAPFVDFIKRPHWLIILWFVFFYKMSDAYMGPMANVFYYEMGFSLTEIASVSKIFGMGATILGGIVGGIVVSRWGLYKSLWICGILQGLTTLVFVLQAWSGHNIFMLISCISLDNISGGMSVAAFVAYLSSLCSVAYTATQYALLSSLMSLPRDLVAATSGYMAEAVGWDWFFVLTSLMVVPGLALLWLLNKKGVIQSTPLSDKS